MEREAAQMQDAARQGEAAYVGLDADRLRRLLDL
jgi:hypothetical protein